MKKKLLGIWSCWAVLTVGVSAQPCDWQWAQQGGGTGSDIGEAAAADAAGNVYVTGSFTGNADFSGQPVYNGGIFLAKYNANGAIQWIRTMGPGAGTAVAVDAAGNVYFVGQFQGVANFGGIVLQASSTGSTPDAFVAKYNSAGTALWAKKIGGIALDWATGVAVDESGVYVSGYFNGVCMFDATQGLASVGQSDGFLARYTQNNGTLSWVKRMGGVDVDRAMGLTLSPDGGLYLTGWFLGRAGFDGDSVFSTGASDVFLARYSRTGNLEWVESAGGPDFDYGEAVATDNFSYVYVTGSFGEPAFFGGFELVGSDDVFLAKYNPQGQAEWAQRAGGPNVDNAYGIATDGQARIWITGGFRDAADFGIYNVYAPGTRNVFVARYGLDGTCEKVFTGDGAGVARGESVCHSPDGRVFAVGAFQSQITFQNVVLNSSGLNDVFVARVCNSPLNCDLSVSFAFAPPTICPGGSALLVAVVLGGDGNYTSLWQPSTGLSSTTSQSVTASPSQTTLYTYTVVDGAGCYDQDTIRVTVRPPIEAVLTTTSASGGNTGVVAVNVTSGQGPFQYRLGSGSFQNGYIFSQLNAGTYNVTVRDVNGCTRTFSATVGNSTALIFPGDGNCDGRVNAADLFLIASGYGLTGPARTMQGITWGPYSAPTPWSASRNFQGANINGMFLDANGDGTVNLFDAAATIVNRGRTR
ncbi:MAG: dockerin type I domain-containing protein [Bacteroidia bacterium]|nr:dockerin type I domain-containing protein [Bacteroidia bacterium]